MTAYSLAVQADVRKMPRWKLGTVEERLWGGGLN